MHDVEQIWQRLSAEADAFIKSEPFLGDLIGNAILDRQNLASALAWLLALKLASPVLAADKLEALFTVLLEDDTTGIVAAVCADISACVERDSACQYALQPFLFFKGFHALQAYRMAHALWLRERKALALTLQSRISEVFGVDIHPAAQIGCGVMLDHATGLVVGETAIIEDDVSIMQSVTLGGTGKDSGLRHPIIRRGSLISAGAKILGRVEIGEGAKIGAGSVVLKDVPAHSTAVGIPARVVEKDQPGMPAFQMDHSLP